MTTTTCTADLIVALADAAAVLRDARRLGAPVPDVCRHGHPCDRFWTFGRTRFCLACGGAVLPADQLHALLTAGLRQRVLIQTEEVAA